MSDTIQVGAVRVWPSGKEIEVVEQVTEGQFAGEFRYRYLADSAEGILHADFLLQSTRPGTARAATTPSLVELDRRETTLTQAIADVLYTTSYDALGWMPDPDRFGSHREAAEHLAGLIALRAVQS